RPWPGNALPGPWRNSLRQRRSTLQLTSNARATSAIEIPCSSRWIAANLNSRVNRLRDNPMTHFLHSMDFVSLQKLVNSSRGSFDDLQSELGSFALQRVNLQLPVLGLIEFHSLVDVLHSVAQHAIYQSGQLGGHGFDSNRSSEFGS